MSTNSARIFISYSTHDGSDGARQLRQRLEAGGFTIWQDVVGLRGGHDWWSQIDEILRAPSLEHLVLVVSDGALERPVIRQEVRLARQEGVQVTPVRATDKLDFANVPRWLGHVLDLNKPEHWQVLVNTLAAPSNQTRVPMMAPEPPFDYVARDIEFEALKRQLIDRRGDAIAVVAALKGAGGYGKTTLAKALAHDEEVQSAYFDGILWAELGENPGNLLDIIGDLIKTLTGSHLGFHTIDAASAALVGALSERRILLIIDDAWREQDLGHFLQGGPNTTRLVTTRIDQVVPDNAFRQSVNAMSTSEASQLIGWNLPTDQARAEAIHLKALSERVGEWPLLVKLVNGFLRQRVERACEPLARAIEGVNKRLDAKGLVAFDARSAEDRSKAVARTINASLEQLDEARRLLFRQLGIFPENAEIPIVVVQRLWTRSAGFDEIETEDLLTELANLSLLLSLDLDRRTIHLHDVVRQFLRDTTLEDNLKLYEAQFVAAMDDFCTVDNIDKPELNFYFPLLLYYSVRARRWDVIVKSFSEPKLFEKIPPITYGAHYSAGVFHGLLHDAFLPNDLKNLSAPDRMTVGGAIAAALAAEARRCMHAAMSYPRPWDQVAKKLRAEDSEQFVRYRDKFYNFANFAGLSANWALAAFLGVDEGETGRKFVEANSDIIGFLDYLAWDGARITGLSGALEDNLAGPSLDAWKELERINHTP
jgi:hypothetical protein